MSLPSSISATHLLRRISCSKRSSSWQNKLNRIKHSKEHTHLLSRQLLRLLLCKQGGQFSLQCQLLRGDGVPLKLTLGLLQSLQLSLAARLPLLLKCTMSTQFDQPMIWH